MSPFAQRRSTFLLMTIRSSLSENIEISYMLIFTRERRNSERRYMHPTTTTIIIIQEQMAEVVSNKNNSSTSDTIEKLPYDKQLLDSVLLCLLNS